MATCEITSTAPATPGEKFHLMIEATFNRIAAWGRAVRNRRSVAKLLDWDERMLRDIGLTPGDVQAAMSLKASEDPSQKLHALSAERRSAIRAEARERLEKFGSGSSVRVKIRREMPKGLTFPFLDL